MLPNFYPKDKHELSEKLLMLLMSVAGNELRTHRLYKEFLGNSENIALTPELYEHFQKALDEDRDHYKAIEGCIKRLNGGKTINSRQQSKKHEVTPRLISLDGLLENLRITEAFSVQAYAEICNISMEYDYSIFDLSYRNMNENLLHRDLVADIIKEHHSSVAMCG